MKNIGLFGAMAVIIFMGFWWWDHRDFDDLAFWEKAESPSENTPVRAVRRKTSYLGQIRAARELMEHDYYSLASVELAQAIREKPDFIEPYLLLGEIYLRTKDNVKLENLIAQLSTKFPNNTEVLALQTRQWINQRKFSETLELLGSLEAVPAQLRLYQAILLALQNDQIGARAILEELELVDVKDKNFVLTQDGIVADSEAITDEFLRAEESQKVRDILIVYEEFENLAESKNAHLFAEIAQALAQNNEAFLAQEFADVAIKEDITYIDAWILRGYSHLLMQQYEPALNDLRYAYELDPIRPEVHYFLALALYENSQYDEAALFFEKALEYDFEFSEAVRWKLLEIFARQKKYDRVLELYRELLTYDADPSQFTSAVHTAVDLMGQPEVALEFTEILMAQNPDNFAKNLHAWALIANERYVQAKTLLSEVITSEPENPRAFLNLGLLAEAQSDWQTAKEEYKKAYEFGQNREDYTSVVNLAVSKYNVLLDREVNQEELIQNPASAP